MKRNHPQVALISPIFTDFAIFTRCFHKVLFPSIWNQY